eukprot:TRINITY_DN307_c0_g1_i1.p1 TRINITY_DN307_c0_g1~~TRINITY_DN307_c0_g1_i1.p1  ORF type:complete len:296 (+),score=73.24 TRINITY_DN307_c0_g1_i1:111-890(+)
MSANAYKEKGNEEYKKGNYEKAIEFYTYATEMDPKNPIYFTNRSMCYAAMKKWEKSLRDAEKSVALNASWEKGHYRKGVALSNMGQYQAAMESFEMCCQLNPKNDEFLKAHVQAKKDLFKGLSEAEIMKIEGNEMFKKGKIDDAIKKYTAGLAACKDEKLNPVKADLYANRAACYIQLYEPSKVRADCDAALKISPMHLKALLRRGQALEGLEKYKAALEDFEKVLAAEPDCKLALDACGRIRNAIRRIEKLDNKERKS